MFKSISNLFRSNKSSNKTGDASIQKTIDKQISKSIEDFRNRPIYKELTIEIIEKIPDDTLLQSIFDNLIEKFPKDYEKEYQTVLSFTKGQQAIYMTWCLEGEVNNGGFNQYYYNSQGRFAKMAPEALILMNAHSFAALMIKANDIYEAENKKNH